MRCLILAAGLAASLLTGCVAPPRYNWGDYEQSMYSYYRDPAKSAEFAASLQKTIDTAEQVHGIVPPGVYAEYGYLLLQQGKAKDAGAYFAKEKAKWPESTYLMDSMMKMSAKTSEKVGAQ